jgi:hypothetical protein
MNLIVFELVLVVVSQIEQIEFLSVAYGKHKKHNKPGIFGNVCRY